MELMSIKKFMLVLFLGIFVCSSAACANVLDKSEIIAATSAGYPPYEFYGTDGQLAGFDIDMTNEIGRILGKKVQWQNMVFDSVLPCVMTGKVDIIAAGMSYTPERAKKVAFSDIYEESMSTFVVRSDLAGKINSVDDLKGKVIAVSMATLQETYATQHFSSFATVRAFQRLEECAREVAIGRADVLLMDSPVAESYVNHKEYKGKLALGFDFKVTDGGKALAMNKDETAFVAAVNDAMRQMRESGKMEELKKKWGIK